MGPNRMYITITAGHTGNSYSYWFVASHCERVRNDRERHSACARQGVRRVRGETERGGEERDGKNRAGGQEEGEEHWKKTAKRQTK